MNRVCPTPFTTSFKSARRGAIMMETAVVGTLMLMLILTVLQLAIAMLVYNSLSSGARAAARMAIVRGSEAAPRQVSWGPSRLTLKGGGTHEVLSIVQQHVHGIQPEHVNVVLEWPSGMNEPGEDVVVELSVSNSQLPRLARWFFPASVSARSVMQIVN